MADLRAPATSPWGGVAIVQDPKDAMAPGMPQSALRKVKVNHCGALGEIGPLGDSISNDE